ncbi:hypothetical protein [Arthrobacter luteolus]|nr:hypothetical protein [Arthrobacter luteolus]
MTVKELIAALSAYEDQDAEVLLEGCDCANPAKAVTTVGGMAYIQADI